MATTKQFLQHPTHYHPLVHLNLNNETRTLSCRLCRRKIWTKAFTCQEGCDSYYYHQACVEAPPQIDRHPLHPDHPLHLLQCKRAFQCDACGELFSSDGSSFRCDECNFDLDLYYALSSLSDLGGYQGGNTSEQITLRANKKNAAHFLDTGQNAHLDLVFIPIGRM